MTQRNSKMKGMYFLCTIHPELEETKTKEYIGGWMTLEEKKEAIEHFYKTNQNIALSIDHKADKTYGSFIPKNERVGKILDLFNDKDGDLVAKCILYKDSSDAFNRINEGFHINKEKWGVSMRIDWCMAIDGKIDKKLTHLALTLTPYLGKQGTYIHHWSTNEKAIDLTIDREYYNENVGSCYASNQLKNKIASAIKSKQRM